MGDESSCFHSFFYQIIRIKKGFTGIFRRIFKSSPVQQQQNGVEAAASVNPEPIQGVRVYEDNIDRDPLRLQIVVSFIPEPQAAIPPPPPPPPPLPLVPPRRRRHSRPIPTYDLATLIEIKDALETLEMDAQIVAVNNNLEIIDRNIENNAQSSNKNTKPNKIDL